MAGIKRVINFIFDEDGNFSLENRLFLSAIVIGILTSIAGAVINIMLSASLPAVIVPFGLATFLLILYYFLRFKKKYELFAFPTFVIAIIGIGIIWIFNGGINGANIMPAFVILILSLISVSFKQKKYVIIIFLAVFVLAYLVQLFFPEIIVPFPSETSRWADSLFTLLYSAYFIFLVISFLHKHYTLERHKSEESEAKYRMLTESMKDVVWTLDAETLHYTYISPSIEKLSGFTPDEIMAEPIDAKITPDEAYQLRTLMKKRLEAFLTKNDTQSIYYTEEVLQPCKNGTSVWTEIIHEYYRNEKNNRIELRGVTRDISGRKKAEQQIIINNQELSTLNAEKDKFFSIIAHDLISPFHSVIGLSKYLVEKVKTKDINGVEKYAETIRQSSVRIMELLTNLMVWSRSQTGRMSFRPENIEVCSLINEVAMLFVENTKQKSIEITNELDRNIFIKADKAMLSAILRNLISNAIKFSHPDGTIQISALETDHELTVCISDSGVGMPEETIEKLFKIDKNHSTPGTLSEQGTGLGLILCKEFAEKHGGKIWVESIVDKGSKFYFTIPARK
jgi:PAS domain S-box-containing protein